MHITKHLSKIFMFENEVAMQNIHFAHLTQSHHNRNTEVLINVKVKKQIVGKISKISQNTKEYNENCLVF